MTVDEVRAIREKKSLETVGMSVSELNAYYSKGATKAQQMIDEIRKQREGESKRVVSVGS